MHMELKDVKTFLLDMDGTFYLGGQLIEGSLDFIRKVEETGRNYMFLTNNSSHNSNGYVEKLAKRVLKTDRSHIMHSGEATCEKLLELYPGKRCFVLGNEFLKADFAEMFQTPRNSVTFYVFELIKREPLCVLSVLSYRLYIK